MKLTEVMDRFVSAALADEQEDPGRVIQGFAVAIIGTERVSYIPFEGLEPTYDEDEATVLPKQDACNLMSLYFKQNRELWRAMRLIPVRGDRKYVKGGMLPTVNGY